MTWFSVVCLTVIVGSVAGLMAMIYFEMGNPFGNEVGD